MCSIVATGCFSQLTQDTHAYRDIHSKQCQLQQMLMETSIQNIFWLLVFTLRGTNLCGVIKFISGFKI